MSLWEIKGEGSLHIAIFINDLHSSCYKTEPVSMMDTRYMQFHQSHGRKTVCHILGETSAVFSGNDVWYQSWSESVIGSSLTVMSPEAAMGEDTIVWLMEVMDPEYWDLPGKEGKGKGDQQKPCKKHTSAAITILKHAHGHLWK
jgi:hypothetical protein